MSGDRPANAAIGERIRQARRELGLTQSALAERVGVMLGVLDQFETGKTDAARHLEKIAEATGKPVAWFLEGEADDERSARAGAPESDLEERARELAQL